jgi:transposase
MATSIMEEAESVTLPDENDEVDLGREEQKHKFVVLRAKGYSYARIARELGVSKGMLTAWNAELEAEIAKTRMVELEALQEEFFLLKEGRIRLVGEQLKTERNVWRSSETRLEKALRVLPTIDMSKLKPTAVSLGQLKAKILEDTRDERGLLAKVRALEYDDGMDFKKWSI